MTFNIVNDPKRWKVILSDMTFSQQCWWRPKSSGMLHCAHITSEKTWLFQINCDLQYSNKVPIYTMIKMILKTDNHQKILNNIKYNLYWYHQLLCQVFLILWAGNMQKNNFRHCTVTYKGRISLQKLLETATMNTLRLFYHCTVHSDICRVHSPTNALLLL